MEQLSLSLKEAQKVTGLSRKVLIRYIQDGSLKWFNTSIGKVHPRYRLLKKELEEFLERIQTTIL